MLCRHVLLVLLLHQAPKACENFLALCASSYYDGVIFHRNIKGFMIQGGEHMQQHNPGMNRGSSSSRSASLVTVAASVLVKHSSAVASAHACFCRRPIWQDVGPLMVVAAQPQAATPSACSMHNVMHSVQLL